MEYVIETQGLTKRYGASAVVDDVGLHVPRGSIYGLLGRNGAGKTTTMKLLLQLARPTAGRIRLFGEDCAKEQRKTYRRIGSIIETPGFYENLTAYENLRLLARLRGCVEEGQIRSALHTVGLQKERKKPFSDYSLGMKQRLGIAAAIMHAPELLILDEPINGLDPIGIAEIRTFLSELSRERGTTILISSHVLSEIEQIADVVGVMHTGRLIQETDMAALHRHKRRYTVFHVSDAAKGTALLREVCGVTDCAAEENVIRIYDPIPDRGEVNRVLVENGLHVTHISVVEETLEDYFSDLIGGGGIA
ncbi:MAG: ABC transporter ATP-binding protein [Clostridia bacterium]|nr:ABC transporter ATP-binding protein [Clostridia bacterium]